MSRRAPLLVGAIAIVLSVAVFLGLVFPKMRQVNETQEELKAAQDQELSLQAELARLRDIRDRAPRIRRQLARFRRQVPEVADLPGLINEMQDIATESGVDFFSIAPANPEVTAGGAASQIPTTINVIGGFFQVDEFLFRLETLRRAAKVVTINIAAGPDQLPQISVTLSVEFYTTDTAAGPGAPPEGFEVPAPEQVPPPEEDETTPPEDEILPEGA